MGGGLQRTDLGHVEALFRLKIDPFTADDGERATEENDIPIKACYESYTA
jgi:hypothetical protein